MSNSFDLVSIERAAFRAWPALETQDIGGWVWRFSAGGSQRANSVATLGRPERDTIEAIEQAEALYAARGAKPQFQISDVSVPSGLDGMLAARGYRINDPCTTLAADLVAHIPMPETAVIKRQANEDWLATYTSVITANRRAVAPSILARVPATSAFCGIMIAGRLAATTLVVLDGPTAIVECVATHPDARRQGAARLAMLAAMSWAAGNGATLMALGAVATNAPAQALYAALGFREIGRYHLRIRDQ